MRLPIPATGLYTYPDALVVCGKPEFADETEDLLLNPTVIVEVLSKATENYDRGDKFRNYRSLESFQEYLLIAQHEQRVEHFARQAQDEWVLSECSTLDDSLYLSSIDCTLPMADIYDKVTIPPRPHILREAYGDYQA